MQRCLGICNALLDVCQLLFDLLNLSFYVFDVLDYRDNLTQLVSEVSDWIIQITVLDELRDARVRSK